MVNTILNGLAFTIAGAILLFAIYAFIWPLVLFFLLSIHYALYTPLVRLLLFLSYHGAQRAKAADFANRVAHANLLALTLLLEALTVLLIIWKLW